MQTKTNAFMLLILMGALLVESGCARWTNGSAGEKDMLSGHRQGDVQDGYFSGATGGRSSRDRQAGMGDIPSLSQLRPPDGSPLGLNSGEERIANDMVTLSPSLSSGGGQYRGRQSGTGLSGVGLSPEERVRGERLAAAVGLQDVFFGYDSSIFSDESRERLLRAAHWLKEDSRNQLLIEGHCDERGTVAYNLVLGEKRARAVQNFLRDQHLDGSRLTVVSYGKERPFCRNHDEPCYQENRRGHFVVRQ